MPGRKPKRVWPLLLTMMLADDDIIRDIVERVRGEFGMAAPVDKACMALNRGPAASYPQRREKILARVEELCAQTTWKGDLDWVQTMFHPEEAAEELRPTPEELAELPPIRRMVAELFCDVLPKAMEQVGYGSMKYRIIHWLTDYAIEGDYTEIKPMPVMFDTDILELPFFEDKLVVALVSRDSDVEQVIDRLRARRRQAFVKRRNNTDPENVARNLWAKLEYQRIKAATPGRDTYGRLLDAFLASRWGYQFSHYNLDDHDDELRARAQLRKMVSRGKRYAQEQLPPQPPLFCDE